MKKGQILPEFIMMYWWSIVSVMLIVTAFVYFGIFDVRAMFDKRCSFDTNLDCKDYAIYSDKFIFELKNTVAYPITIESITISSAKEGLSAACNAPFSKVLNPFQTDSFEIPCTTFTESSSKMLQYDVSVVYAQSSSQFTHTYKGELFDRRQK